MDANNEINRRDLIVKTAGASAIGALAETVTPALAETEQPPPGFAEQQHLKNNWTKQLKDIVDVTAQVRKDAPELTDPAARERHRIYCYLLMKLIYRFWNGNKRGPLGRYPLRAEQIDRTQSPPAPLRFRGDMISDTGGVRINWDRYLGHNIACIAVDGNGEIIDFDFNHNDFFRSSAEHAESRMVRRLFSLTDIFDNWKTGLDQCNNQRAVDLKPRAASLNDVTLYTSLESCAQCSGIMSLASIKQVIYLQNDFTAYKIGNIMYILANQQDVTDVHGNSVKIPGAPIPIAASDIDVEEFSKLNEANLDFSRKIKEAANAKPPDLNGAFFVPENGPPDFSDSITSFLCTDAAHKIFEDGGSKLDTLQLQYVDWKPNKVITKDVLTNSGCLKQAKEFYKYADVEGYRGSPHKL